MWRSDSCNSGDKTGKRMLLIFFFPVRAVFYAHLASLKYLSVG